MTEHYTPYRLSKELIAAYDRGDDLGEPMERLREALERTDKVLAVAKAKRIQGRSIVE